jgi:hypothetical protein
VFHVHIFFTASTSKHRDVLADIIGRQLGSTPPAQPTKIHVQRRFQHYQIVPHHFQTSRTITSQMERPPPHSADAIRAKRVGGKKVPKQYRKYHKTANKNNDQEAYGMMRGFMWFTKGLRAAFEALR